MKNLNGNGIVAAAKKDSPENFVIQSNNQCYKLFKYVFCSEMFCAFLLFRFYSKVTHPILEIVSKWTSSYSWQEVRIEPVSSQVNSIKFIYSKMDSLKGFFSSSQSLLQE